METTRVQGAADDEVGKAVIDHPREQQLGRLGSTIKIERPMGRIFTKHQFV